MGLRFAAKAFAEFRREADDTALDANAPVLWQQVAAENQKGYRGGRDEVKTPAGVELVAVGRMEGAFFSCAYGWSFS